ncbi:conserved hypothetical protein [Culex quinquefasciatus]|uniref:Uncharacterized protein n=1 Tax=Culex quinquefasciatus TaxID=7176 RepID=B0VZ74_CULQU|nr:conserved hypothetical protein [Culex quinquefasciatus]|eukprot:XP_001841688.1 conserved hypothetical protein [Culex quinquefasciatus]
MMEERLKVDSELFEKLGEDGIRARAVAFGARVLFAFFCETVTAQGPVNVSRNQVIIETTTPDQAFAIARDHNSKHFIVHAKKRFLIPIYVEDGAIEVKVHDLPPRTPNHIIEEHLQQYGEIISIHNEVQARLLPRYPERG